MPIVNRIADLHSEIKAWRQDIHAHPELLYDVHRTAATVAEKLKAFGCDEVVPGIGRTKQRTRIPHPVSGSGRTLRALKLKKWALAHSGPHTRLSNP